jgi:alkane 1-monooxygenase
MTTTGAAIGQPRASLQWRALKYTAAFILPAFTALSFSFSGWLTWLPLAFGFVFLPVMEFALGENPANLGKAEAALAEKDPLYDILLYLTAPVQWVLLIWFFIVIGDSSATVTEMLGRLFSMGLMCGVYGINVAHELGHRPGKTEQLLSKAMLLSSLYMHFFIEHNRGHHRNVATPEDPATARRGESIYRFWLRTVVCSVRSAWHIVARERARKRLPLWSPGNELLQYIAIEAALCTAILWWFGPWVLLWFFCAALMGILLLESVNYIEHYGLMRRKRDGALYEDVNPGHSWNSDYVLGRLVLFELTRHSDHHTFPARHYQCLESVQGAQQLPAGYPAMILLSFVPPLWFRVMDPLLQSSAVNRRG